MSLINEFEELRKVAEQKINLLSKKSNLEKKLSETLSLKFTENMTALSKYLPDVYQQFINYQPDNLQFICTSTGIANIIDETTGKTLYSDDPIAQCREQVDKQIDNPQFTKLSFEKNEQEYGFIHVKYMNKFNNIYNQALEELVPIKTMPDHLGSMLIFGVGLGYHLTPLLEDISIDHLYLCEPNCDWFYASLYTADWKYILETIDERDGSVYFYLGASYVEFTNDFLDNLKDKGAFNAINAVLYQHYPSDDLNKLITRFSEDFHRCSIGWGFFDDGIISIAHDFANGQRGVPLLKKSVEFPKHLQNIPVFVIANGPSLDECIATIQQSQSDAVIFACGSALQPLLANDIIPDFYIANERTKSSYHLLDEFIDHDKMKQINFLTTTIMQPECADLFKWTGMVFKPAEPATTIASEYIDNSKNFSHLMYSNPVVGNTGSAFACYLGFDDIYLFGLDFGYKDPTRHHSKDSFYYNHQDSEVKSLGDVVRKGEIQVDGNFVDRVYSTTFFNVGKCVVESLLKRFPKVNCYNCSDGAKIAQALPLAVENILIEKNTSNKQELIEHIKSHLFIDRNFSADEYEKWLDVEKFDEICDELVAFVNKDFTNRAELATALKLQARYLFSYSPTRHRHIYFMLQGSLTYVQALFKMMLYSFDDEKKSMELAEKGIEIFKSFMLEAKEKYRNVLNEVSDHKWSFTDAIKESRAK